MCKQCEKNPVYEFTNKRKLCKNCFVNYFHKKVFYIIRKFKMVNHQEIIGYENKKDFREVVLEEVLKKFSEKFIITLVKLPSKKKIDKKAIASTIDLESEKIIHALIKGKTSELKQVSPIEKIKKSITIKPLYLFLDKEVLLYAKIKKLKFKKTNPKKDNITKFVDNLEEKHPEVKRAIVNSYLELYS